MQNSFMDLWNACLYFLYPVLLLSVVALKSDFLTYVNANVNVNLYSA